MKKKVKVNKQTKTKANQGTSFVIGFIGAGNMAQAMMKAMGNRFKTAATDVDPEKMQLVHDKYLAEKVENNRKLVKKADLIIIAVKPQNIDQVLNEVKDAMTGKKAIMSIAAATTIKHIQDVIGRYPVVRVMPNTPVLVGEGACAYASSKETNPAAGVSEVVLQLCCKVAIKIEEEQINAVTAISGSGPAYFFYIAEAMVEAGLKLGLSGEHLHDLIAQTIIGAGKMIEKSSETPDVLRQKVTSRGGTTEKAISEFERNGLKKIVIDAVVAAKTRADELGK